MANSVIMLLDNLFPVVFLEVGDKDVRQCQPASVFLPDDILTRGLLSGPLRDHAHNCILYFGLRIIDASVDGHGACCWIGDFAQGQ